MKKIISLFKRDYEGNRLVIDSVTPGAEWVIAGEGVATRKWDGTCCLVQNGKLFKRFDCKGGLIPPDDFIAAQDPDPVTGHWPGWRPVGDGPEDQWHRAAYSPSSHEFPDGTYELVGPKINGNREKLDWHVLVPHLAHPIPHAPRDFDGLVDFFSTHDIEGIVWHHPDGRMVKIKGKDFGIKRDAR